MPRPREAHTLFDPGEYELRVARRRGRGYAAQVYTRSGYWDLGVYATRREARDAAAVFAASGPIPGEDRPECWHARRSDGHRSRYNNVRRVKGGAYQARVWVGRGVSLNLGLFTQSEWGESAEWAAGRAARSFLRAWQPGVQARAALAAVRAAGHLPARVVEWPCRLAEMTPPVAYGPTETAEERREREREERESHLYPEGGLLAFAGQCEAVAAA